MRNPNPVIGAIAPGAELTEAEAFDAPTRTVNVIDTTGRLRGQIQWLAEDVGEHSKPAILQFYAEMTEPSHARNNRVREPR